jgi:hypothetical protein
VIGDDDAPPQESVAADDAPFVATSGRTQRVRGLRNRAGAWGAVKNRQV